VISRVIPGWNRGKRACAIGNNGEHVKSRYKSARNNDGPMDVMSRAMNIMELMIQYEKNICHVLATANVTFATDVLSNTQG
jgi:hypothetical protein